MWSSRSGLAASATPISHRDGAITDEYAVLLGHEAAGVIESIGSDVTHVAVGDFVVLNWRAVSGQCRVCRRGRPWQCFDTFNASVPMTRTDGTKVIPALGIGRMRWYRTEHKTIVLE